MNADENALDSRSGACWRLLIGLAAVFLSRLVVLQSRLLGDVPYEPTPLGLEAFAVLRGETPVLVWGQPYFGTLFSYLLAPFYALGTEPMRTFGCVAIAVAVCGAAAVYGFARRLWGEPAGLAALAYLAIPSASYSYHTLTAYAVFQALGSIACLAALRQLVDRSAQARSDLALRARARSFDLVQPARPLLRGGGGADASRRRAAPRFRGDGSPSRCRILHR